MPYIQHIKQEQQRKQHIENDEVHQNKVYYILQKEEDKLQHTRTLQQVKRQLVTYGVCPLHIK